MKNFYVTYAFEDNEARKNFYGEVKAAGIVGASRAEEGCFRYEFYYPADSENKIFLLEQWKDMEVHGKHKETPHYAVLSELKEKYNVTADILVEDAADK